MWRELIRRKDVIARDGAKLRAYVAGTEGPTLVLASGLGGPLSAWRYQIAHFAQRYQVVSWDYRGLFDSALAHPDDPVDVASQADDLTRVLDHLGTEQAVVVGWSMGVQVALEHYRNRPDRTTHLVLINGTAGRPFDGLFVPGAGRLLPPLIDRAHRYHRAGGRLLRRAARTRSVLDVFQRMGTLTTALPPDLLEELALEFAQIDVGVYLRTLRALGQHDAAAELGGINVPALVIAGGRDVFTPKKQAEHLARAIERAELVVVPEATHYAATEYPDLVNQRIEAFLTRHRS
jgi:pimeloyl-ACP methyl ester carboxylesterase